MENVVKKTISKHIFSLLFLSLVCFFGFSGLAFFKFNNYMYFDILFIPVLFASMIGGYIHASFAGTTWGLIVLFSGNANLPSYLPITYVMFPTIATAIFSVFSYEIFKKYNKFSPNNVYFTLIVTIIFKSIITIMMGNLSGFYSYYQVNNYTMEFFLQNGLIVLVEVIFAIIIMKLTIKKLRNEYHVLNGVKYKVKNGGEKR